MRFVTYSVPNARLADISQPCASARHHHARSYVHCSYRSPQAHLCIPTATRAAEPLVLRWILLTSAGLFTNITTAEGSGFPSGHALGTTIVWGGLALVLDRRTDRLRVGVAGIVVGLVSLSRLVLGVHYFINVLVGIVLGIIGLRILYWLADYGTDPGTNPDGHCCTEKREYVG
ncbi:phosphatase PAP2 family protein [Haladaptatus sp. DYF46]|uniref:phosphatase PAP2 family protein n=1 Tax=Haladaptatus sp. DYF46 TaxID=2886041 RepID=UPI001E5A7C7C|nr:phosphatase PAP2 family protein [Haladaptatus sp. DYF46]